MLNQVVKLEITVFYMLLKLKISYKLSEIEDVQKSLGSIFVHKGTIKEGIIEVGREVEAAVDENLRQRVKVVV